MIMKKEIIIGVFLILLVLCVISCSNSATAPNIEILTPSSLYVTQLDSCIIHLEWIDNCSGEDGYDIERREYDSEFSSLITLAPNDTTYVDSTASKDEIYYYRIRALGPSENSEFSIEESNALIVPDKYSSIQTAINNSYDGSIVLVKPGTYYENIDFQGKEITLSSLIIINNNQDFINSTIIDGNNNSHVVKFENNEDLNSVLSGFTIRNGFAQGDFPSNCGGGILCERSSPLLKNLIITENIAEGEGGGISCYQSAEPLIHNVSIINNTAGIGGGISCYNNSSPSLINVLIANNQTDQCAGGIYALNSSIILENVTVTQNVSNLGAGFYGIYCGSITLLNSIMWNDSDYDIYFPVNGGSGNSVSMYYSCIQGGIPNVNATVNWGEGNITDDPLFIDPENGDFHLQSNSPCIDSGDPAPIYLDYDGSRNDIGAYGGKYGNW